MSVEDNKEVYPDAEVIGIYSRVILLCSFKFFEKLVIELLIKMGYGG